MSDLSVFECFQRLIDYLEENNVADKTSCDDHGYTSTWRSVKFGCLIDDAKEKLKDIPDDQEAEQVPSDVFGWTKLNTF